MKDKINNQNRQAGQYKRKEDEDLQGYPMDPASEDDYNDLHQTEEGKDEELKGYPLYPTNEDIYLQYQEEDINPEDIPDGKEVDGIVTLGPKNDKNSRNDMSGRDIDFPPSEWDDEQEDVGIEDEENTYFSLGGDDHSDLDETDPDVLKGE